MTRRSTRWSRVWLRTVAALAAVAPVAEGQDGWTPTRCMPDSSSVVRDSTRTMTRDTVAPGIAYRCILDRRGPWVIHLVTVDLKRHGKAIDAERALGRFFGRERVSDMATRLARAGDRPLVGINADFFDLRTGEIENNHVVRGEWVKGALATDSPHDEFDNAHTQFGLDTRGRPLIGRFELDGTVLAGSRRAPLVGVNYRPARREGLVLFTPWYGPETPRDTSDRLTAPAGTGGAAPSVPDLRADSARRLAAQATREAGEVVLRRIGRRADTVLYRAAWPGEVRRGGGTDIPSAGAVLSATGSAATGFAGAVARTGGPVKVVRRVGKWATPMQAIVGGWPRVVTAGVNVGARADSLEGTFQRFSAARHPRSALAITRDSSTLLMFVVDGRRPWSVGMSLAELGDALLALGAWDAMNLDGGGSSALWIRGSVVNYPSDATGERPVGNALFVLGPRTRR